MHPEGPATGHLDTGFLGFQPSAGKCWDGSQIPCCYCMLFTQPPRFKLIQIVVNAIKWLVFPNCLFSLIRILSSQILYQKINIPLSLSRISTSYHSKVFTFIYTYKKDQREKPGNLITKLCSLSDPYKIKSLSLPAHNVLFVPSSYCLCFVSLLATNTAQLALIVQPNTDNSYVINVYRYAKFCKPLGTSHAQQSNSLQ
jgi:hypothetical protein